MGRVVKEMRSHVNANKRTAEDVLHQYIGEYYGRFVVVRMVEGAQHVSIADRGTVDESITRSQVYGRVEIGVQPGYTVLYIEESQMRAWCSSRSFGYSDFKTQIANTASVRFTKRDLLAKTKGPQMRVNCIAIMRETSEMEDVFKDDAGADAV